MHSPMQQSQAVRWGAWRRQGKWVAAIGGLLLLVGYVIWAAAPSDRQGAAFYPAFFGFVCILAGGASYLYYSSRLAKQSSTSTLTTPLAHSGSCQHCGKPIPLNSAFCQYCGGRVS
jgi:hypothetical protein